MNSRAGRFNIILAIFASALLSCQTADEKEKDKKKQATSLRFHIETNADESGRTTQVPVYRARPMLVTIDKNPVLDEGLLEDAEIVDADEHGGVAIKVTFDESGARRLDAVTIQGRGLHLAIGAKWTEMRWLAAPLITKRISNGVFIFTPDATREEAERIVNGLKNVIKKAHERYTL